MYHDHANVPAEAILVREWVDYDEPWAGVWELPDGTIIAVAGDERYALERDLVLSYLASD